MDGWKKYCHDRLRSLAQLIKKQPQLPEDEEKREKVDRSIEIEIDEEGYPIWPEEGDQEEWNVPTRRYILRSFLTAHYRK